jgi:hypothetical protein
MMTWCLPWLWPFGGLGGAGVCGSMVGCFEMIIPDC